MRRNWRKRHLSEKLQPTGNHPQRKSRSKRTKTRKPRRQTRRRRKFWKRTKTKRKKAMNRRRKRRMAKRKRPSHAKLQEGERKPVKLNYQKIKNRRYCALV